MSHTRSTKYWDKSGINPALFTLGKAEALGRLHASLGEACHPPSVRRWGIGAARVYVAAYRAEVKAIAD